MTQICKFSLKGSVSNKSVVQCTNFMWKRKGEIKQIKKLKNEIIFVHYFKYLSFCLSFNIFFFQKSQGPIYITSTFSRIKILIGMFLIFGTTTKISNDFLSVRYKNNEKTNLNKMFKSILTQKTTIRIDMYCIVVKFLRN